MTHRNGLFIITLLVAAAIIVATVLTPVMMFYRQMSTVAVTMP